MGSLRTLYDHEDAAVLRHLRDGASVIPLTEEEYGRLLVWSPYGVHDVDSRYEPAVGLLRSTKNTPLERRLREDAVINEIERRDRMVLRSYHKDDIEFARAVLAEMRADRLHRNNIQGWTERAA